MSARKKSPNALAKYNAINSRKVGDETSEISQKSREALTTNLARKYGSMRKSPPRESEGGKNNFNTQMSLGLPPTGILSAGKRSPPRAVKEVRSKVNSGL